jgi:hypothetical protein
MPPCQEHVPRPLLLLRQPSRQLVQVAVATPKTKAKAATIPEPTISVMVQSPSGEPQTILAESTGVPRSQKGRSTKSKGPLAVKGGPVASAYKNEA